jgi:hypothetical protein
MAGLTLSNAAAKGLEGVSFVGTRDGAAHEFLLPRESLEDLVYAMFETPEAMLEAFGQQQEAIAKAAAQALDGGASGAPIVLQSLI